MSTITDDNSFFNLVQFKQLGGYSASQGTQDVASFFSTSSATYVTTSPVVDFSSNAKLTHGFNTYFKMQGFNTATNKYEVWFSTSKPLLIPPSGHTLSNIEIVLTWIDR
jgi:hypothetical protein